MIRDKKDSRKRAGQVVLLLLALCAAGAVVAGCFGVSYGDEEPVPARSPIQHVVVIMQENRTFDNLFNGFPGADSAQSGMSAGATVALSAVPLAESVPLPHGHGAWWRAWDRGKMDGFADPSAQYPLYAYSYVRPSDVMPYWTMARSYTLVDRMFQSNSGSSFPAHQYMIAGQSGGADGNPTAQPWGCNAPAGTTVPMIGPEGTDLPGPFPCFDYTTLADILDKNRISWRYYAPAGSDGSLFSAYEAIRHIFGGSDWSHNVVSPQTKVLSDVASGYLAHVTWVVPDRMHSDLPGNNSNEGPDWVASVVNAVATSRYWDSTAIFITWDDWGGWYDHVPPDVIDKMGPGFRVPLIVISPYARRGYVSHRPAETASLLTFIEKNFSLPDLNSRDATAGDLSDCFDFHQEVRPFSPIPMRVTVERLLTERSSGPPDDD